MGPTTLHDPAGNDLWVGVDLGTQSVKVEAFGDRGEALASAATPLTSRRFEGRHEQEPKEWISGVRSAITHVVQQLGEDVGRVRALAVCSTSGTLATVTAEGSPIGPGIMYDDGRASALFTERKNQHPDGWEVFGESVQPSWGLAKLLWLHTYGTPPGTSQIAHQSDVVVAAMVGHAVPSDWSSALKSGYSARDQAWLIESMQEIGIDATWLPEVVAPGSLLGHTSLEWQHSTGLPKGISVFAGATDGCAAQIGAGALNTGEWHSVLGTTLVLKGVSDTSIQDAASGLYSHLSPDGKFWWPGGASNAGAGVISRLLPGIDVEALSQRAEKCWTSIDGQSPVCYPLMSVGERFPLVHPEGRGFITTDTGSWYLDTMAPMTEGASNTRDFPDQPQLLAGIMLGVACAERLCFEKLAEAGAPAVERLSVSGGGSRNIQWNKLRASMLDLPVHVMNSSEGSLGMAMLAAWAMSNRTEELAAVAKRMNHSVSLFYPDPKLVKIATMHYDRFTTALEREGWNVS